MKGAEEELVPPGSVSGVRGGGIDQATNVVNEYDCRGDLLVNASRQPWKAR